MPGIVARALILALAAAAPATAYAHHVMDGQLPATFLQGLLSGLGHPIIGADHFAFIVGIGMLAAATGLGPLLPLAFVVAMCAGLAVHFLGVSVPGSEVLIAASVLLIGLAVLRPRRGDSERVEGMMFAAAGALHGYALAETIIGAEQGVIAAYVLGLVAIQVAVASAAYFGTRLLLARQDRFSVTGVRIAGGLIATAGLVMLAGASGLAA